MPKANLNTRKLADKLVSVVDRIRSRIPDKLGTRPWKVAIVTRHWSGGERGVGLFTDTVLELDPTPQVRRNARDRMGPAGREPTGSIVLTGVSLSLTQEELMPKVDHRSEYAYRLTEAHGQGQRTTWYLPDGEPIPRRGGNEGDATDWYITLTETQALPDHSGGVDAP